MSNIITKLNAKIETLKVAQAEIIKISEDYMKGFEAQDSDTRRKELETMDHADLINLVLSLEKPKTNAKPQSGELLKRILMSNSSVALDYETIAQIVCATIPGAETSAKSARSIAHDLRVKGYVLPKSR